MLMFNIYYVLGAEDCEGVDYSVDPPTQFINGLGVVNVTGYCATLNSESDLQDIAANQFEAGLSIVA